MDYLENARRVFKEDYFATEAAGIVIDEVEPGYAKCTMPLGKIHKNAAGNVMGGAVFTLADFAFGVAANTEERVSTVSLTSEIRLVLKGECPDRRGQTYPGGKERRVL